MVDPRPSQYVDETVTGFARGWPMGEDRRKRAFRSLVSDIAQHLDNNNVKDINWQEGVPASLQDRPALDVLQYLHRRGVYNEHEVRPLVQLLKDIHREDLIGLVDAFREQFGELPSERVPYIKHEVCTYLQINNHYVYLRQSNLNVNNYITNLLLL